MNLIMDCVLRDFIGPGKRLVLTTSGRYGYANTMDVAIMLFNRHLRSSFAFCEVYEGYEVIVASGVGRFSSSVKTYKGTYTYAVISYLHPGTRKHTSRIWGFTN